MAKRTVEILASIADSAALPNPGDRPVRRSAGPFDVLHVVVAEAEMMADLVDEDMAHDVGEILAGLAPVIEDRPAIEKDHVDIRRDRRDALMRQGDAAIEAEYVERALQPHLVLGLLVGGTVDADDDRAEMALQLVGNRRQRALRHCLEIGKTRWGHRGWGHSELASYDLIPRQSPA